MKCADPVLCYLDSKGKRTFRHFSIAAKFPGGIPNNHLVFNCGTCLICRKKRARELAIRCVLHSSLYKENCFLTLTYDEKKENYHNDFEYSDIQKFKKRLRAYAWRTLKKRIQVFNVHEYGAKGKKHWHLICFNMDLPDKTLFTTRNGVPLYSSALLDGLWTHGFTSVGDVNEASAMYQAQYMEKDFKNNHTGTVKKSNSKHSGLAKPFFYATYNQMLRLGYIPFNGKKIPLPRYFEKLAERHYCHFYDQTKFIDTDQREAPFRSFRDEIPNREIADLYIDYRNNKKEKILELEKEWNESLTDLHYLTFQDKLDFIKSASNKIYDLKNKQSNETL